MVLKISQLTGEYRVGPSEVQYYRCPVCGHEGWGKFYVNRTSGVFYCHAGAHRGRRTGVVDDRLLLPGYNQGKVSNQVTNKPVELPYSIPIQIPSPAYRYLSKRGISQVTYKQLHFRDWIDEGRILIPFFNQQGDVVGYTGRDYLGTSAVKYRNADGARVLYAPHLSVAESRAAPYSVLVVVEGPLDAVAVWQAAPAGVRVCALGGRDVAANQTAPLVALARGKRVLAWLDADDAGQSGGLAVARRLGPYAERVRLVRGAEGLKDPASHTPGELARILLENCAGEDFAITKGINHV